jgi:hypothetical protein
LAQAQPYEESKDLTMAKPNFESFLAVVGFTVLPALDVLLRCPWQAILWSESS